MHPILPRPLIGLAAALLIAAPLIASCGEAPNPDAAPPGSEPQPDPPPGPVGPPAAPVLPFVGAWSPSATGCADNVWEVRADGLDTPGEVSCRWDPATVRPDGPNRHTVSATCTAENPPESATLTFTGDGQNLTIEGAPFQPLPLVRCTGAER